MSKIGHNGGPPDTDDVPNMHFVKFFPGDFLNGTAHMNLEQVGAYIRLLCVMYDRMGGFPYDDHKGSILLRVDRRVYRRVRDMLIADGKVFLDGDTLRNTRVEHEISSYVTEYKRRSEAAKKREAERRERQTYAELSPDLLGTSAELPPEVREKSGELGAKNVTKSTKQKAQDGDILEARSQKLEARIERIERNTPTPLPQPLPPQASPASVWGLPREGEEHIGSGVFVNCETIRHRDFSISLLGIEMQLVGTVPMAEIKSVAIGHALQWALDIESGKPASRVVPSNPASFIRGSIQNQRNNSAVTDVRRAKAAAPKEAKSEKLKRLFQAVADEKGGGL